MLTVDVFDSVKQKITNQQLEIDEKSLTCQRLKQKLDKLRSTHKDQLEQSHKSSKSQLNLQRKEYETIVKRHLGFIDKLIAEKESLADKCEALSEQVKSLEKEYSSKTQTIQESHLRELKAQKELVLQQEKIKRDKWIQEKTRQIKDQTVKSLEPEIQNLIAQHKVQLRQSEEQYRRQVLKEKSFLMEQGQQQLVIY